MKKFIKWFLIMSIVCAVSFFLLVKLVTHDPMDDSTIKTFLTVSGMIGAVTSFMIVFEV